MMKCVGIIFLLAMTLSSCAHAPPPQTLDQFKADWECLPYQKEMGWRQIFEKLGEPDLLPLPDPGTDLSKNTRIYRNKLLIFHAERREVQEGEKVRFQEVITNLEICRKK